MLVLVRKPLHVYEDEHQRVANKDRPVAFEYRLVDWESPEPLKIVLPEQVVQVVPR